MSEISPEVRRFAEESNAELSEPLPPEGRVQTPRFSLYLAGSRTDSLVCRVRTTEAGLDETIAEVRALLRERGYTGVAWSLGPSCEPRGLTDLLLARGFVRATEPPHEPEAVAMALVEPPPAAPDNVEARLCRTFDEYVEALRIAMKAFEVPEEGVAGWMEAAPKLWPQQDGIDRMTLIAHVDGRPVGFGFAAAGRHGLLLGGSGVLTEARGRGAYRALLAARWKIAVGLGKPALVIHAGVMSLPVLERCGFQRVCKLELLVDPKIR